jgi:hypothetical protein
MSIIGSDPLAFLTAQGGVVGTPLTEEGAKGIDNLDVKQRNAVIGEPIPIVFCRRISGIGGVLISPPATEAAFSNNSNNDVTASYLLVLSEGQIDSIQVRDVFQGACRVGSFTQTYNRRAGTFVPGNTLANITVALVQFSFNYFSDPQPWTWYDATLINGFWKFILGGVTYNYGTGTYPASVNSVKQSRNTGGGTTEKPEAPTYCGTGGTYAGLSTMAFTVTIPSGFDQWNRQVHCFIRGGIYVPRLLDSVVGPSNNVADLLLYLLRNSSRVPEAMIDTTSFLAAATFTNVNGFWFNGVVSESTNLRDWIGSTLQYFLLRQARVGGKEALKPLVQTNANGTIKTAAVTWAFTFTEEHVIPESFDIIYTPLADRKPFCAVMLWRQQDDLGIPVMRTTEVRYTGTAPDGPFEQHDLSGFCSSENHAVKVGAYILSKRNHVTHRLQLGVKPDAFNPTLAAGDLVRVRLERTPSTGASSLHDYLYEVDRIGKSLAGEVRLDLTYFPVDDNKASVVAQEVNAAVGGGLIIGTGASAITCDINSFSDTSVPAETFTSGSFPDYGASFNNFGGSGGSSLGDPPVSNPADGLSEQVAPTGPSITGTPAPGNTLTYDPGCPGAYIEWRLIDTTTGEITVVSSGEAAPYIIGGEDEGKQVVGVGKCPGSEEEISSPPLLITDGFIPFSGTANVTYRQIDEFTTLSACVYGSLVFVEGPKTVNGSTQTATVTSVVGYRFVQTSTYRTFTCAGAGLGTAVSIGLEFKRTDGSIQFVGIGSREGYNLSYVGTFGSGPPGYGSFQGDTTLTQTFELISLT